MPSRYQQVVTDINALIETLNANGIFDGEKTQRLVSGIKLLLNNKQNFPSHIQSILITELRENLRQFDRQSVKYADVANSLKYLRDKMAQQRNLILKCWINELNMLPDEVQKASTSHIRFVEKEIKRLNDEITQLRNEGKRTPTVAPPPPSPAPKSLSAPPAKETVVHAGPLGGEPVGQDRAEKQRWSDDKSIDYILKADHFKVIDRLNEKIRGLEGRLAEQAATVQATPEYPTNGIPSRGYFSSSFDQPMITRPQGNDGVIDDLHSKLRDAQQLISEKETELISANARVDNAEKYAEEVEQEMSMMHEAQSKAAAKKTMAELVVAADEALAQLPGRPGLDALRDGTEQLLQLARLAQTPPTNWGADLLDRLERYVYTPIHSPAMLASFGLTNQQLLLLIDELQYTVHCALQQAGVQVIYPVKDIDDFDGALHQSEGDADLAFISADDARKDKVHSVRRMGFQVDGTVVRLARVRKYVAR